MVGVEDTELGRRLQPPCAVQTDPCIVRLLQLTRSACGSKSFTCLKDQCFSNWESRSGHRRIPWSICQTYIFTLQQSYCSPKSSHGLLGGILPGPHPWQILFQMMQSGVWAWVLFSCAQVTLVISQVQGAAIELCVIGECHHNKWQKPTQMLSLT